MSAIINYFDEEYDININIKLNKKNNMQVVDKKMMNRIIENINDRIYKTYLEDFPLDTMDFTNIRTEDELNIIENCIKIMNNNYKNKYPKKIIYTTIIFYYYSVNVLEYYLKIYTKHYIIKKDRDELIKLVFIVATSNDEWASQIRRLVYKF